MITNINTNDFFNQNVTITYKGNPYILPWINSNSGPIVTQQEFYQLNDPHNTENLDLYTDIKLRFVLLRKLVSDSDYVVIVNGNTLTAANGRSLFSLLEKKFEELNYNIVNADSIGSGYLKLLIPESKSAINRKALQTTDSFSKLSDQTELIALDALDTLLGSDDVALQIGWISIGTENADPNSIKLGPDKVTFVDHTNVMSTSTIRSDTDVALKLPGGRSLIEIDIIFPNKSAINGKDSEEPESAPGLRNLLGLLRMTPVVPVGGAAITACLINEITASDVFEDIKRVYFNNYLKSNEELLSSLRTEIGPAFNFQLDRLNSILKNERETFDLLKRYLDYEQKKELVKIKDLQTISGTPPSKEDFVKSLRTNGILIPLICTSVSVTTIKSSVGALRVKITFERMHNPYETSGGLAFYDSNGNITYDIRKCTSLIKSVETVYLNPKRFQPNDRGDLLLKDNAYYIPKIGDTTLSDNLLSVAGLNTRMSKSDAGHTLYAPPASSTLPDKEVYSPIMFRFSPAINLFRQYEYVPYDLILENIAWNYTNKVATFPMEGQLYPGFQLTGRSLVNASLKFSTTSRKAVQRLMTIKNAIDAISKNTDTSAMFRREFCDVYNDVLILSAASRWIISSIVIETNPDNVSLYEISMELVSNMESVYKRERLELVTQKPFDTDLYAFWQWLYGGIVRQFEFVSIFDVGRQSHPNLHELIPRSNVDVTYTNEELNAIWELVFGKVGNDGRVVTGILEENIFIAAFLEMLRRGSGKEYANLNPNTIFKDYFDQDNPNGSGFSTLNQFLSRAVEQSINSATKGGVVDGEFQTNNGNYEKLLDIPYLLEKIADAMYNLKPGNPWVYTKSGNQDKDYYARKILLDIKEKLDDDPEDTAGIIKQRVIDNNATNYFWIPTPDLWQSIWYVINNWNKLVDKDTGRPYKIQTDSDLDGDVYAFLVSTSMKTMRTQLSEIANNSSYRSVFPSFWNRYGKTAEDSAARLKPLGTNSATKDDFAINTTKIESNNNYIDIPMPKYFEIFSDDLRNGSPPKPSTYAGYEVWKRIAPTFLELGIKPELYSSVLSLTDSETATVQYPALLTPRSFYDYCDPGFFYYKKSWLVDNYVNIIEDIDNKVNSTKELSPTGGNKISFKLNQREINIHNNLNRTGNGNKDLQIKIGRADFSIENFIQGDVAVENSGVRTTFTNQEVPFGLNPNSENFYPIQKGFATAVENEIHFQANSAPAGSTKNNDLQSLYELYRQNVDRIWVLDATGRKIGAIVSADNASKGKLVELKNLSQLVNSRFSQNGERANFYYIDLTSATAKSLDEVVYEDQSGVLSHNTYKDEDAAKLFRDTLNSIGDIGNNHLRAYPTFKLYFVKERVENDRLISSLEDDMYGYASVISLDITLDKDDAATAKITVTDITGVLSTSQYESDNYLIKDEPAGKDIDNTEEAIDEYLVTKRQRDRIKLQIGTNIVIKMGYGNNPDTLKTIFTGAIAEIEPGEITTIIAQDYKTELYRHVNFASTKDITDSFWDFYIRGEGRPLTAANYLIFRVLRDLATSVPITGYESAGGIPHLGHFISFNDFEKYGLSNYSNEYQETRDREAKNADTRISNIVGLIAGIPTFGLSGRFITNSTNSILSYLRRYDENFMHTNAMRNVFITNDPMSDGFIDYYKQDWLVDTDGWNAIKEITRYKVGYVSQVLPYGTTATLFVGKPDQPYHYKPLSYNESSRYAKAQPYVTSASNAVLYNKIFKEFFNSDEYGKFSIKRDFAALIDQLNYKVSVESYLRIITSRLIDFKELEKDINALTVYNNVRELRTIDSLPSFHVSKSIVERCRKFLDFKDLSENISIRRAKINDVAGLDLDSNTEILTQSDINDELVFIGNNRTGILNLIYRQWADIPDRLRNIKITEQLLSSAGYTVGDYWAIKSDGSLLSKSELSNKYKIDPQTGQPIHDLRFNFNDLNNRITDAKQNNADLVHFATTLGYGSFTVNRAIFGSNERNIIFNPYYNDNINQNIERFKSNIEPMVLLKNNEEELKYIESFGPTLLKTLFGTFFGLSWIKEGEDNIVYINNSKILDNVFREYTQHIMQGINDTNDVQSYQGFIEGLVDPIKGVLSPIYNLEATSFGDLVGNNKPVDVSAIQEALDAEIKEMVRNGRISNTEYNKLAGKAKEFIALASIGQYSNKFLGSLSQQDIIKEAIKDSVITNKPNVLDTLYKNNKALDPVLNDAFSKLIGLDTSVRSFNPDLIEDVIALRDKIIRIDFDNIQATTNTIAEERAANVLLKYSQEKQVRIDRSNPINFIDTLTGRNYSEIFERIKDSNTIPAIASGISSNSSIFEVLVYNSDYYKLFLLFFVKWLKKNNNADSTLREIRVNRAVNSIQSSDLKPGQKRFQDVHYIVSGTDIIENNIVATMSEMANNILLLTPSNISITKISEDGSEPIYSLDVFNTKHRPYPNFQYNGIDYNPFVRPELRKQRVVIENNAETDLQRLSLLINHMAEAVRPMYRGHIKIIGRAVKPHDKIILIDTYKDVFGILEVDHVTHNFSSEHGWTTTIIPHAFVSPEFNKELLNQFDTSMVTLWLGALDVVDHLLTAVAITGVVLSGISAGTSGALTAGAQGAKAGIRSLIKRALSSAFKNSTTRAAASTAANNTFKQVATNAAAKITGTLAQANWKAAAGASIRSLFGSKALGFVGASFGTEALKWGLGLYLNVYTEQVLRSTTLPIHVFCLTRFGQPFQAGLDNDVTTWYSWSERFGLGVRELTNSVSNFIDEAFKLQIENPDKFNTIFNILEGR